MDTRYVTVACYAEELASKAPVPGGGGASALSGALGCCLGQMVCNLTIGKKKYAPYEEEVSGIVRELSEREERFFVLADRDAEVFEPLAKAYSLPHETEAEQAEKDRKMEQLLYEAAEVPLSIMEEAEAALHPLSILFEKGSVMAVSDVGAAACLIRASLSAASLNVQINTKSMKDRTKAAELDERADLLLRKGTVAADEIFAQVRSRLSVKG